MDTENTRTPLTICYGQTNQNLDAAGCPIRTGDLVVSSIVNMAPTELDHAFHEIIVAHMQRTGNWETRFRVVHATPSGLCLEAVDESPLKGATNVSSVMVKKWHDFSNIKEAILDFQQLDRSPGSMIPVYFIDGLRWCMRTSEDGCSQLMEKVTSFYKPEYPQQHFLHSEAIAERTVQEIVMLASLVGMTE